MKKYTILFLITFPIILYAQDNQKIAGVVLSKENQEPLEFVSIGILNKNIGTISFEDGNFELYIPNHHKDDKLTFSMVGYKVLTIPINDNIGGVDTFFLEKNLIPIAEAKIIWEKPKTKKVGTRIFSPVLNTDNYHEVAHKIEPKRFPARLKDVNIYLHVRKSDTATIRLHIFKEDDNKPDTFPIMSQICHLNVNNGWHRINLEQANIVMNENFYIGVFLLPSYKQKKKSIINYGVTLLKKGDCFIREGVLGKWEHMKQGNYSIYANLLYFKNRN